MGERHYPHARVRGLAPYSPQKKTQNLISNVERVLAEYADHLPLTIRQIFYRLVGKYGYPKSEQAYNRLCECLNRARRGGLIAFDDIRDDGVRVEEPSGFSGTRGFWGTVRYWAEEYRLHRMANQSVELEIWVEAGGMVPQIAKVAHEYGIPVYSSGGFNSITAKYDTAARVTDETVILHIGDHDPSGLSVFDSLAEDVTQMVFDLEREGEVSFERVAVTPAQIDRHGLPTAPPKRNDKRGQWEGGTVQAEALPPDVLASEVRTAILRHLDEDAYHDTLERERRERRELIARIEGLSL
ncbi:MAG: hypothetical protein AAGF92_14915 [Myxococcota bacterium]